MRHYTAATADRKRLIAAKRPLRLTKLTDEEYKEKFISPRKMLEREAGLAHRDHLLVMNSGLGGDAGRGASPNRDRGGNPSEDGCGPEAYPRLSNDSFLEAL